MLKNRMETGSNEIHDEDDEGSPIGGSGRETPKMENLESVQEDGIIAMEEMKQKRKKALLEFRCLVSDAILGNYLLGKPKKNLSSKQAKKAIQELKEISLWGVPLLPTKGHEGTDIVLLKFLKAKDFKVHEAFNMLQKTLKWRRDFMANVDLEQVLDPDFEKIMYLNCKDKEGQPLCYNIYGPLKDRELYKKFFGSKNDSDKFIKLKVQLMEKGLKELSFKPGGPNSMVQITDLKDSPGPGHKEFSFNYKKSLMLLQNHYPDLIYRNIFINVPFWYYVYHVMSSKFISQRTKRKFVFARESNVTRTLLKYITPENLPVEYGGLYRENDDFFPEDRTSELIVRKNTAGCIQIPVSEEGVTMIWDFTVVDWDASYKEEFIPDDEGSYRVLLREERERKGGESIRNSFYISEPGKIVITIDNSTYNKKKVFYRFKTKPTVPMYVSYKK
ncbi:hypothetical protein ACOSP7_001340 [Xanthoceras sorbifolium]|uniref:CRAL-TRIO domain-containing protein n=1 Tax=Xanthoceras sorbifolium TaxID=99658 RepID=A0ABQ8IMW2_9ROSI|nr:hypothetical protein JRO89_XS01G0283500 [Xanthoceras sorbifolium]